MSFIAKIFSPKVKIPDIPPVPPPPDPPPQETDDAVQLAAKEQRKKAQQRAGRTSTKVAGLLEDEPGTIKRKTLLGR